VSAIRLLYTAFTMLRHILSILSFFRDFIMKRYWILSKVVTMIVWLWCLILFMCCIRIIDLCVLNP
jgi:hypothetical protein